MFIPTWGNDPIWLMFQFGWFNHQRVSHLQQCQKNGWGMCDPSVAFGSKIPIILVSKILVFPGLEVTWGHLPGTAREFLEDQQLPVVLRVVATRGAFAAIWSLGLLEIGRWFEIFRWMVVIHVVLGVVVVAFFLGWRQLKNQNETKPNNT